MASDQGGTLVENLPDDTAAAIGVGLAPGWLGRYADQMSQAFGGGKSGQQLLDQLSRASGLDLPTDVETLLGSSTALSISKDFDFEAASMSSDGEGVPVAVTVRGDADAIEKVLDKVRAQDPQRDDGPRLRQWPRPRRGRPHRCLSASGARRRRPR